MDEAMIPCGTAALGCEGHSHSRGRLCYTSKRRRLCFSITESRAGTSVMLKHNLLAAAPWREMRLAPHGDHWDVQTVTDGRMVAPWTKSSRPRWPWPPRTINLFLAG